MTEKLNPAALSPETLAKLLSASLKRVITEEQVLEIAETGNLLSVDGTINLVQYTASLVSQRFVLESP